MSAFSNDFGIPVQPPCLLQYFKHVLLKNVQSPVAATLHIHPDDIKVERCFFRGGWIHSGYLSQRVTVTSSLFVLVAQHGHKQVPDQLSHQRYHGRRPRVLASLLSLAGFQQHAMQHQSIPIDERLGLIVHARVVEHESKVLNQRLNVLVPATRHMASHTLHINGFLDSSIVVRQLGTRRQAEEDCAQTPSSAVGEVSHGVVELI